jgi:hypothetical protein
VVVQPRRGGRRAERAIGIEEADRREKRRGLTGKAHPQHGVDAMADEFDATTPLSGVVDAHGS